MSKWLMTLVAMMIVAGFGYWLNSVGNQFDKFDNKISAIQTQQIQIQRSQAGMQKDINWIKLGVANVETKEAAQQKHAEIYRTDQDQYQRLDRLNKRVSTLEQAR